MVERLGWKWETCGQEPDQWEGKDENGRLMVRSLGITDHWHW